MSKTDPIADYLTRIRNAAKAKHRRVDIPSSNLKRAISKILLEKNYITGFTVLEDKKQNILFKEKGYNVLRFWEKDINKNREKVKLRILKMIV